MRSALFIASLSWAALGASPALAWDPFHSENDEVETGNQRMAAGDAEGALRAYDQAARALPNDPGVQLNRGLALMESGDLPAAREAFLRATEPPASAEMRASAYYDLGLAFYREGDAAAGEEDHQTAQQQFREAADAFRRSLRLQPGNRDCAWNLELALRRIREEQERQEQQEREQQDQQGDDQQQNQDQQGEDPQQNQDQQGDDQQGDDPQGDDPQGDDQQGDDQQGDDQQQNQDQQGQDQGEEDRQQGEQQQDPQDGGGQGEPEPQENPPGGQRLPEHVERVLDNLQDDEESLERARARARAARERRRVVQDW